MKTIIKNDLNIKEEDIKDVEIRVKAILINNLDEILFGYSYNCYQLIGGHVEEKEKLIETLKREITEEAGITLEIPEKKPDAIYIEYLKNKKKVIYYYIIKCNEKINLKNTNYTKEEKIGNFNLRYIKIKDLKKEIIDNSKKYSDALVIANEMLPVFKELGLI